MAAPKPDGPRAEPVDLAVGVRQPVGFRMLDRFREPRISAHAVAQADGQQWGDGRVA
jgi:hypothetical protein